MTDIRDEAATEVRKFLDEYAQMRGTDPEDIYSIHRGTDKEAHLYRSHLEVLSRSTPSLNGGLSVWPKRETPTARGGTNDE